MLRRSSFRPMVSVSLAFCVWLPHSLSFAATNEPDLSPAKLERRLYVADKSGLSVYDIDRDHKLIKKIAVPDSGDYKGICANPDLATLYLTSNTRDELICLDLITDGVSWRKKYGAYADSMAISPSGLTIYLPCRHDGNWWAINPVDGDVIGKIETGRGKDYAENPIGDFGPHNTWCSTNGARVYLEVLTEPYIYVADTPTLKIVGKVGPFSKGVGTFAVSDDNRYVFANVDGLLGFEIGDVQTGKMIQRVEARTPPARIAQIKEARKPRNTPSRGINLRPDQKEVWLADDVYGYAYVYDVTVRPPKQIAEVPLFEKPEDQPKPAWITFSLDGKYAYADGGAVIDTQTKKVVARIPKSEMLIEIDFVDGQPLKAGHR